MIMYLFGYPDRCHFRQSCYFHQGVLVTKKCAHVASVTLKDFGWVYPNFFDIHNIHTESQI